MLATTGRLGRENRSRSATSKCHKKFSFVCKLRIVFQHRCQQHYTAVKHFGPTCPKFNPQIKTKDIKVLLGGFTFATVMFLQIQQCIHDTFSSLSGVFLFVCQVIVLVRFITLDRIESLRAIHNRGPLMTEKYRDIYVCGESELQSEVVWVDRRHRINEKQHLL